MQIDLLRHGECDDEAWLRGSTDSELSENGLKQMLHQCGSLQAYDLVLSSSSQRCSQFVEQHGHCRQTTVISDIWQERNFGIFDGMSFENVERVYPDELKLYLEQPFHYTIPQSESFQEFQRRIEAAWQQLLQRTEKRVLIVTHGGVIRLVLQQVLKLSNEQLFHLQLGYASKVTIEAIPSEDGSFCKLIEIAQSPGVS